MQDSNIKEMAHSLKICLDYIDDCEDELESNGLLDNFIPITRPFGSKEYGDAKKVLKRAMDGPQAK